MHEQARSCNKIQGAVKLIVCMDESLSTQLKTTDYAHSALILRALGVQLCARFQSIRVQKLPPKSVDGLISPSGHAQSFQPTYDFDRKQARAYAIRGDVIIVESPFHERRLS